jgi:hypothetical protein
VPQGLCSWCSLHEEHTSPNAPQLILTSLGLHDTSSKKASLITSYNVTCTSFSSSASIFLQSISHH